MTLTNRTYHCLDGIFLKNGLSDSFILARRPQKFHPGHAPGCGRLCQFLNVPTERIYSANGPKYLTRHQTFLPINAKRHPTMRPFAGISCASMLPYGMLLRV